MKKIKYQACFYRQGVHLNVTSLSMNEKAFSRVLELVLVLVLLFALVATVSKNIPPARASTGNLLVLSRHVSDIKNMVCNSERDRKTILQNLSLDDINQSINYISPPDLKHRILVLNASDQSLIQATGFPLPSSSTIMTSSCIMVDDDTKYEVEVMVWY